MDGNKSASSSSDTSHGGGAVRQSMFNIASIRDSILDKLNTTESTGESETRSLAGDGVSSNPDVQPSSRDVGTRQGGAEGRESADKPPTTASNVTNGHVDTSAQEAVSIVTDLPQAVAGDTPTPSATDGHVDTSAQEGVLIFTDLPRAVAGDISKPIATYEHVDTSPQEGVTIVTDLPQAVAGDITKPIATDGHVDTSAQEGVLIFTDLPRAVAGDITKPIATYEHVDTSPQEDVSMVTDLPQAVGGDIPTPSATDGHLDARAQGAVTITPDLPAPQAGASNEFQEDHVVIKTERVDEAYDLHVASSSATKFAEMNRNDGAFGDLNVKFGAVKPETGCAVDDQDGDVTNDVVIIGCSYRNPYSDTDSDTSSVSSFQEEAPRYSKLSEATLHFCTLFLCL